MHLTRVFSLIFATSGLFMTATTAPTAHSEVAAGEPKVGFELPRGIQRENLIMQRLKQEEREAKEGAQENADSIAASGELPPPKPKDPPAWVKWPSTLVKRVLKKLSLVESPLTA